MSVFLLPKTLCDEINSILSDYWWRNKKTSKGIHWLNWGAMCEPKEFGGIGFRDMAKFNIALLTKQAWRLFSDPGSLVARVLRAKYYSTSSFLNSNLGSNPSLTWRSIWSSKKLLFDGLIWRISNGRDVSIWDDYWIPGFKPAELQQYKQNSGLIRVSDLLDDSSGKWRYDTLHNIFPSTVVNAISGIPVSSRISLDRQVWGMDNSGLYTVKSGYRHLIESSFADLSGNGQNSVHLRLKETYKTIWNLPVPSKIRICIWRVTRNLLPSLCNLFAKRITNNNICPRCNMVPEDLTHIFSTCTAAASLWHRFSVQHSNLTQSSTITDWIIDLFSRNTVDKHHLIAILIWALWYSRNLEVFERKKQSAEAIYMFVVSYINDLDALAGRQMQAIQSPIVRWQPPPEGYLKINVDAAIRRHQKLTCAGVVVRNAAGELIKACTMVWYASTDSFIAEAWACLQGLQLAFDSDFQHIILESDNLTVVKKLMGSSEDLSPCRALIEDGKRLLRSFASASVLHVRRNGNMAAHFLADWGISFPTPSCWAYEEMNPIQIIVHNEKPPGASSRC